MQNLRRNVLNFTLRAGWVGAISLLLIFRLVIQPTTKFVPDLWLEIKTLNSLIATALIALCALFAYPLALGVIFISVIFVGAKPLVNS